ncbi:unnamed protein product [Mytilus edulis]|uniref:Uncharacterized protein n=1 Tax=Mytilus edulis TaxID=6550 RepID=A0A8S3SRI4_MYTED|nr:unnamed protein product [Mytilus edulis]
MLYDDTREQCIRHKLNSNQGQGEEEEEDDAQKAAQSTLEVLEDPCPQDIDDYIPDEYYFDEENQDYARKGSSTSVIVKRENLPKMQRMKWTDTEEEEIRIACLFLTDQIAPTSISHQEMAMHWLVDGLSDKALPKTMILCTSIKDAANIYAYISTEVPKKSRCSILKLRLTVTKE